MRLKHKSHKNYVCILVMIFLCTNFILKNISSNILYHVENIIIKNIDRSIYNCIFFTFSNEELGNEELLNVIELNKNDQGQVISVDYNFDIMYEHLANEMELLYKSIDDIKLEGYNRNDKDVYFLPVGLSYNNILLDQLGFKIPFKIDFIHDIDMGFKTKVKNYGVNNLLIEVYVVIDVNSNIMSPSIYKEFNNSYEMVVASKIVVGEIPMYIGDIIEQSGTILSS